MFNIQLSALETFIKNLSPFKTKLNQYKKIVELNWMANQTQSVMWKTVYN